MTAPLAHPDYPAFLAGLKARILHARTSAARVVNRELILLYWDIGRGIVEKQRTSGWGDSVIDQISRDLQEAFPGTSGFSPRNLRSIRQFYSAYSNPSIWPQAAAKLPAAEPPAEFWLQPAAKLEAPDDSGQFPRPLVAEIPWGHHLLILNKLVDPAARIYYLGATARLGWSRNVLLIWAKYTRVVSGGGEFQKKRKLTLAGFRFKLIWQSHGTAS